MKRIIIYIDDIKVARLRGSHEQAVAIGIMLTKRLGHETIIKVFADNWKVW